MHAHVHVHIDAQTHARTHAHAHEHTCTRTCTLAHMHTHMTTHIHMPELGRRSKPRSHVCTHTCMNTCQCTWGVQKRTWRLLRICIHRAPRVRAQRSHADISSSIFLVCMLHPYWLTRAHAPNYMVVVTQKWTLTRSYAHAPDRALTSTHAPYYTWCWSHGSERSHAHTPTHLRMVSVTRQPFSERTLCSSHPLSTELWLRSRFSGIKNWPRLAYSTSISTPLNCAAPTGR